MGKQVDSLTGPNAWHDAKTKAQYGRKDWVAWLDKNGEKRAERRSMASLKRAMLAVGTQGWFIVYHGGDTHGTLIRTWSVMVAYWANSKPEIASLFGR